MYLPTISLKKKIYLKNFLNRISTKTCDIIKIDCSCKQKEKPSIYVLPYFILNFFHVSVKEAFKNCY